MRQFQQSALSLIKHNVVQSTRNILPE